MIKTLLRFWIVRVCILFTLYVAFDWQLRNAFNIGPSNTPVAYFLILIVGYIALSIYMDGLGNWAKKEHDKVNEQ